MNIFNQIKRENYQQEKDIYFQKYNLSFLKYLPVLDSVLSRF